MPHKRLVALDLGEKRIGVAVADSNGLLAMPWAIVERQTSHEATYLAIHEVLEGLEIDCIIVGLPISLDGQKNQAAEHIADEAQKLLVFFGVGWKLWDERNSSKEALSLLKGARRMSGFTTQKGSVSAGKSPANNSQLPDATGMLSGKNTPGERRGAAGKASISGGGKRKRTKYEKTRVDDKAAALILQSYLDSLR